MNKNMPVWLGWTLCASSLVGGYALLDLRRVGSRRRAAGPGRPSPLLLWALKTVALAVVILALRRPTCRKERSRNATLTSLKGVPIVVAIVVVLLVVLTFLLTRTAWGRHVYAVGGNAEAARRAGINVPGRARSSCFMICSTLAAVAGVLLASRDNSVSPTTGGVDDAAVRRRCGGHRRHQPVRRQGPDRRRDHRWPA